MTERVTANLAPQFVPFLGGVMLMGLLSAGGPALYAIVVAPGRSREGREA